MVDDGARGGADGWDTALQPKGRGSFPDVYFQPRYDPEFDSASKRNEYQEYFLKSEGGRWVSLTTLPPHVLEIWETQPPEILRAYPGLCRDCFTFDSSRLI